MSVQSLSVLLYSLLLSCSAASLSGLGNDDLFCLGRNMLFYNGSCFPPLSSKPCPDKESSWLVLSQDDFSSSCTPRSDLQPGIASCSHPRFDVFGSFSCDCKGFKSKFVLHSKGSPSCGSSAPPCPIELRDALQTTCGRGFERKLCCVTELIGSCEDFGRKTSPSCSDGSELSTFYFNLTGSYFHDYHDFYEKEGGFGDYFSSSGQGPPEDSFFNSFLNDSHFGEEGDRSHGRGGDFNVCPDGTPYPSDCPLPVCCPENKIGMDIEMEFCEKSGYAWNKALHECIPKLFLGSSGRLLDYVASPELVL